MMDEPADDIEDFMRDLRSWALNTRAWAKAVHEPTAPERTNKAETRPAAGPVPT